MNYPKRKTKTKYDDAVSPVVGVMLMLVVTIIIAAVVSAYAGGLINSKEKAPSISIDAQIQNGGNFANSYFTLTVNGISQQISTKDLKLVTTWSKNGTTNVTSVIPGNSTGNWSLVYGNPSTTHYLTGAPWGFGPGVASVNNGVPGNAEMQWGNYTLTSGTKMVAYPAGQSGGYIDPTNVANGNPGYGTGGTAYTYNSWTYAAGSNADGMQTVLGNGWEQIRTGDTVNVKIIHIPTGMTIFNKNVQVS